MELKQQLNCPKCNTENRPEAKFCKECGTQVTQTVFNVTDLKNELKKIVETKDVSQETIQKIRDKITSWSNSIPHHDAKNLGENIETIELKEIPVYKIDYKLQFEERKIYNAEEPYRGQRYPKGKIDLDDYDVWKVYEIELEKKFNEKDVKHNIAGTFEIETCRECLGAGKVVCYKCNGDGRLVCSRCNGIGYNKCYSCDGRGIKTCSSCSGKGRIERSQYDSSTCKSNTYYESCSSCGGRGTINCSRCGGGGRNTCSSCDGSGRVTCSVCSGFGKLTCSECMGYGKILYYKYIGINFYLKIEVIKNKINIPAELYQSNNPYIYNKKIDELVYSNLFSITKEKIEISDIEDISQNELKEELCNVIKKQEEIIEQLKNTIQKHSGTRCINQCMIFEYLPLYYLKYKHLNKE